MKLIKRPIVQVTWIDSHGGSNDQYTEQDIPHEPAVIKTIGWLLRDDAVGISIANENCDDSEWRGHTLILRALITNVKYVTSKPKTEKLSHEEVPRRVENSNGP